MPEDYKNSDMDLMSRARMAFRKQGDTDYEAIGKARTYVNFYKKQKKKKVLFDKSDSASVRG